MGSLTPEAALLLEIARPSLDEANRERIRALIRSGLDWDFLKLLVARHRLGTFLYVHLDAVAQADVPRPVFMDLWRTHESNARRNGRLAAELARVVDVLEDAGVPAVPFKGPVLAAQLYGDVALREFEDLDLLVRLTDLPRVQLLLSADRYDLADPLPDAAEQAMYRSRAHYHRVFVHRDSGEKLEVHWKTDPHFPVERTDDAGWWASLPRQPLDGRPVRSFPTRELLVLLCLHATKHQGHRLGWFVEIAQLIRRESIDWEWIIRTIDGVGCRRRVLVSLLLARQWASAPLPPQVLEAIEASPAIARIASTLAARLFSEAPEEPQGIERLRIDLALCDRVSQQARHVVDVGLSPSLHEWRAGPVRPAYLHLPARLTRLAGKYAAKAVRQFTHVAR